MDRDRGVSSGPIGMAHDGLRHHKRHNLGDDEFLFFRLKQFPVRLLVGRKLHIDDERASIHFADVAKMQIRAAA